MANPKLVSMSLQESKSMGSAPNVLKDFNGLIRVPVARISNSDTLLLFPMSYQQDGVTEVENKVKTIAGFDLVCAFKGTKIKMYLARLISDNSPIWLDLSSDWVENGLYAAIIAELKKDWKNLVPFTTEELSAIEKTNEDGTSRRPMECENGAIVFGFVAIQASRVGRVVKYGNGNTEINKTVGTPSVDLEATAKIEAQKLEKQLEDLKSKPRKERK